MEDLLSEINNIQYMQSGSCNEEMAKCYLWSAMNINIQFRRSMF